MPVGKAHNRMQEHIWQGKDGRWYTKIPNGQGGYKLLSRKTEADIRIYLEKFWRDPTVEVLFYLQLERKKEISGVTDSTIIRNTVDFNKFFTAIRTRLISAMDEWAWIDFLEHVASCYEISRKRYNEVKGITRGILKYCLRHRYINFDIEQMMQKVEVSKRAFKSTYKDDLDDVYPEADMRTLLTYLENHIDGYSLAIGTLYYAGLRLGECCALERSDFHDGYISITKTEQRVRVEYGLYRYEIIPRTKTDAGTRNVVLPDSASWIVDAIGTQHSKYAFLTEDGRRIDGQRVRRKLKKICDAIGIPYRSPHKLRKTYASILLDSGADMKFIEKQMGHTAIETTQMFYYRDRKDLEQKKSVLNAMRF